MLFKEVHLKGIKSGEIKYAFRKWEKNRVNIGSRIHTSVGLIEILNVVIVNEKEISAEDSKLAGYDNVEQLLSSLKRNSVGTIYKISVGFYSADPRILLRQQTEINDEYFHSINQKLEQLDKHSKYGNWTNLILLTIQDNPNLHASGIAALIGFEKEWLKLNIRKLKNLGLTISHTVGYELSPLGKSFLVKHKNQYTEL